jgi:hypothetical protein
MMTLARTRIPAAISNIELALKPTQYWKFALFGLSAMAATFRRFPCPSQSKFEARPGY